MVAVGVLLPMVFHAIPNAGSVFAPMHLPVFCAGFVCGPFLGALVGLICPLLSFLFTGMPAVTYLPNMMCELLVYGTASGLFFRLIRTKNPIADAYISLVLSMIAGRITGGVVAYLLFLGGNRKTYSWSIFLTTYFVTCWPAIVIQLLVIPTVVTVAQKTHFLTEADRFLDPQHTKKNVMKQQRFFDGLAGNWRTDGGLDTDALRALLSPIQLKSGDRVLDAGCGAGVIDGYLLSCGCTVDAVDVSAKMIERAKADPKNNGVNYSVCDFYEYLGGSGYDFIIVFDAYPHFIDKARFAKKAHELLRDGGELWIAFDESREKINGYHKSGASDISVDLLSAKDEAKRFKRLFVQKYEDDGEKYLLGLIKK